MSNRTRTELFSLNFYEGIRLNYWWPQVFLPHTGLSEPWKKSWKQFGSATSHNTPHPGVSLFGKSCNRKSLQSTLFSVNCWTVFIDLNFSEVQRSIEGYLSDLFSDVGLVDTMVWWAYLKIVALERLPWSCMMNGLLTLLWRIRKKRKHHCCRNEQNNIQVDFL